MPAARRAIAMSDEEVERFLAAEMKVQVASIGADGAPHLTTLFYVIHDGKIAFWTYGSSQKVRNLGEVSWGVTVPGGSCTGAGMGGL